MDWGTIVFALMLFVAVVAAYLMGARHGRRSK
jgi:hypothetical protein